MNPIERRHLAVLGVLDSSRAWQASTAEALDALLRPELADGEAMPDLELLQRLFRRALDRHWRRLQAADDRCLVATHRRRTLVGRLKAARRKLGRAIAGLRAHLTDRFGAADAAGVFVLRGETSEVPEALVRQGRHVVDRLCDPAQSLPDSPYPPTMADRRRWAEPIRDAVDALGQALARASRARKEAETATAMRRRLREPYDELFVGVTSWLEACYRLAGREDRAAAVRPSKRRKGLRLVDERQQEVEKRPAAEAPTASSGRLLRVAPQLRQDRVGDGVGEPVVAELVQVAAVVAVDGPGLVEEELGEVGEGHALRRQLLAGGA
jgi:hypothetical protein